MLDFVTLQIPLLSSMSLPCNSNKINPCNHCYMAKSKHLPFPSFTTTTSSPLQLIHSDVWGPSPITSYNGFRYYIIFVDDFSRFTWVYFMTHKSEVPLIFAKFKEQIENLLNCKIKILRTNGGIEHKPIQNQYPQILHQTSCPYTPQQNDLAERKHRHIIELSLATISHASIPNSYWDEIFSSVVYLINRLPSHTSQIPFETLFAKKPDYSLL